jgi:hypothetical protein
VRPTDRRSAPATTTTSTTYRRPRVIVLSTDKDAVLAEIARVLRLGERVGISDIVRHGELEGSAPAVDCADRAITVDQYRAALWRAGLTQVSIEPTERLGGGLHNATVQAAKPCGPTTAAPAPTGSVRAGQVDGPSSTRT